jgi:WhiB family transcriptional regulator, redox-sensing transcriptional regulator
VTDWRQRAKCRESGDPDAWFTERVTVQGKGVAEYALGFCRRCPVQAECLEAAMALDERWGIWGGATNSDRGWAGDHRTRNVGGPP